MLLCNLFVSAPPSNWDINANKYRTMKKKRRQRGLGMKPIIIWQGQSLDSFLKIVFIQYKNKLQPILKAV